MAVSATHFRLLAVVGAALLAACATNRFKSIQAGSAEESAKKELGEAVSTTQHTAYKVAYYESSPTAFYFLKYVDGRLVDKGQVPRWTVDPEFPFNPKRPLNKEENYVICRQLLKVGLPEESLVLMRRYVAEHPDTNDTEIFRSMLFHDADMPDSAVALYKAALDTAKSAKARSNHQNNLLATYIRSRRMDEAEAFALELLADSSLDTSIRHGIHYNLACIYSRQNRRPLAIEQLKQAIDRGPEKWAQDYFDHDRDFDNIRTEPGYLEQRKRVPKTLRRRKK